MNIPKGEVPANILKDSVLARIAGAYFSVGKRLERKTGCSATRGFILSTLRGDTQLNQNQIATQLGLDRTVVHRAIKSMVQEGLLTERKARTGRAILMTLSSKGEAYRKELIAARMAADEIIERRMSAEDRKTLLRLLDLVAHCEF